MSQHPINPEVKQETKQEYPQHQSLYHNHFRSFSHDGHLNQYTIPPTSHNVTNFNTIAQATPPNEVEEHHHVGDDDNSPSDSDGSHSYHEDVPPNYAPQSYHGMSVNNATLGDTTLGVNTNVEILAGPKAGITMIQPDALSKDYLAHPQVMDQSLIGQEWEYH
jgi:hypothetical protein